MEKHYYLHNAILVGEHLRYVSTDEGEWMELAVRSAGARHLKARGAWIGQRVGIIP